MHNHVVLVTLVAGYDGRMLPTVRLRSVQLTENERVGVTPALQLFTMSQTNESAGLGADRLPRVIYGTRIRNEFRTIRDALARVTSLYRKGKVCFRHVQRWRSLLRRFTIGIRHVYEVLRGTVKSAGMVTKAAFGLKSRFTPGTVDEGVVVSHDDLHESIVQPDALLSHVSKPDRLLGREESNFLEVGHYHNRDYDDPDIVGNKPVPLVRVVPGDPRGLLNPAEIRLVEGAAEGSFVQSAETGFRAPTGRPKKTFFHGQGFAESARPPLASSSFLYPTSPHSPPAPDQTKGALAGFYGADGAPKKGAWELYLESLAKKS